MHSTLKPTALVLALLLSPVFAGHALAEDKKPKSKPVATSKAASPKKATSAKKPSPEKAASSKKAVAGKKSTSTAAKKDAKGGLTAWEKEKAKGPGPLVDFGGTDASADVKHVANWVSYTRNNFGKAFVLIDKKDARMYVFEPSGKLKSHTPILLGKAVGDHTVPGIGNKPFSQIKDEEMTTPAGRFWAQRGKNNKGEQIIWLDYNASVSMHRLRAVSAEQKRAERMDTSDSSDNRISYGCVNVPAKFYDSVLNPIVGKPGAFVYVLPETTTPQRFFGTHDVPTTAKG